MPTRPLARILVVDDDKECARVLRILLANSGYEADVAHTCFEAILKASGERFDVALCDLRLPDGSGLYLLSSLRAFGPIAGIVLTGDSEPSDIERSRSAGFEQHLLKPVDFAKLEAAISQALHHLHTLDRTAHERSEASIPGI